MDNFYLGLDGGQSATLALVADYTGRVIGVGRAGPCTNDASIAEAVNAACRQAGIAPRFAAACLGFSGGPQNKEAIVREGLQADHLRLTHDAAIALDGALAGEPGIIVIAGTGSIAYGRNVAGQEARAGGWGYVFGDEGSAFDIVRQALRAALRNEEGWGPRTALTQTLLEASGAATMNGLLHQAYTDTLPREQMASWAPLIDDAANNGDAIAIEILRGAGQQLAMFAATVLRQLFGTEPALVSYAGGVFHSARALDAFQTLSTLDATMEVLPPKHSPAAGALIGAYRLAGKRVEITNAPNIK